MQSLPRASHRVETPRRRGGSWLPSDHRVVRVREKVAQVKISPVAMLVPPVQQFSEIIYGDPTLLMLARQMLAEVPTTPPYDSDIRDLDVLLQTINLIVQEPPAFVKGANDYEFVGFPINAILVWPMGTKSGMVFFRNPVVNAALKQVLSYWATFLASPASTSVLTTNSNGWFGPAATSLMPNFAETFICDPTKPAYGFASFDAFFTRLFRPGVRPVPTPGDPDVIINACESQVYQITSSVQRVADFDLKGQPYSLENMLDRDPSVAQFVGGTVYQAFLSALKYHRWHAPVDGTVVSTKLIPGTYYLESPVEGFPNPDPSAQTNSQRFLTSVATRGLIFIQADNPAIGLMCFVAVGMAEVSSCEIEVTQGQKITKGQEIGMFHFGGSTHCLVFGPQVKLNWSVAVGDDVNLSSQIAKVG
ncbi:hypothetical protein FS837_008647 [Tulasnella sp. UAMH 9824]|nr:hypothetical protein FS837_008647 [Tulasnella sp. UAMH 9824]